MSGAPSQPPPEGADIDIDAEAMLREHLSRQCEDAAALSVADHEGADAAAIGALLQTACSLLTGALESLDVVELLYGGDLVDGAVELSAEEPSSDAEGQVDPRAEIADVVVLARLGLRSRLRALRALGAASTGWERLAATDSALRTLQRSLGAVHGAMAVAQRAPQSFDFYEHTVERSLDVRMRYFNFHRRVARVPTPTSADVAERVRFLGNAIAQLLGSRAAAHLRTKDRALLMMAHARAREWLSAPHDDASHQASGVRLWQDVVNIATMFLDVSRREELLQHDARLVRELLAGPRPEGPEEVAAILGRLRKMPGRSPVVDVLLERPANEVGPGEVWDALESLERTFSALPAFPRWG